MHFSKRHRRVILICLCVVGFSGLVYSLRRWQLQQFQFPISRLFQEEYQPPQSQHPPDVALVVASQKSDDTQWLTEGFPQWEPVIYVTDDRNAKYRVPANRGREAMVYLTYIIDNYHFLSNVIIFSHSKRYQWHNDDPLYDGQRMLSRLQIRYIREQGYVNLRCVWTLGCPSEIRPQVEDIALHPQRDPKSSEARHGWFYRQAFETLFPGEIVPATVAASCCAQLAVTGEKVRERPKSDYERYRQWLLDTTLKDDISGRILEYSWHIIFGKDPVYCPNASQCYCSLYGLCRLKCEKHGVCNSQYTLPRFSTLPQGWPDITWDNKPQNVTELRAQQELDYTPNDTTFMPQQ